MSPEIAPSILAADFLRLHEQVQAAERGGARRFQIDVMDGVFVPNISFGMPLVEAMRRATDTLLEAHLMIVQPERYLEHFAQAGADLIIVHQEAVTHLDRAIQQIKQLGKRAGVALCPATPLHTLGEVIEELDMLLVMTVNPGFGGQRFIPAVRPKIRALRALIDERGLDCRIELDGGIHSANIHEVAHDGAEIIVSGSGVLRTREHGPDYAAAITALRAAAAHPRPL